MIVANDNTVEDVFKSSAASLHSDMNAHVGKYNMPSIDSLRINARILELKVKSSILVLWIWRKLLIGCQEK